MSRKVLCVRCGAEFIGINAYHVATAHGWFCSDECVTVYAKKNKMTEFQVHNGV